ncbi:Lnk1-like isoform x2 [Thalictrum thalictroides]|uniref:Lnk1-like isoform x2 n=1 Tax=Thalictrum thalictroides TaxID=46969 RepID=A0A7J6WIV3_THATH|nr:Lnk1-like isoform x2 [Thalictrum thalictroides]
MRESNYYRGPCTRVVPVAQPDCTKRLLTSGRSIADITSAAKNVIPGWEENTFSNLKEGSVPMLDTDSWTYNPDDKFLNFCQTNCNKEATNLASEDCRMSLNCFRDSFTELMDKPCKDAVIHANSGAGTNIGFHHFPLGEPAPTDGDVNMLCGSEPEIQECSYLSYDGWSDHSYVDDFNGLMRGFDSSLGLETNDDMSWFSSPSLAIGGSGDASELGFKPYCSVSSPLKSTIKHHESDTCRVPNSLTSDFDGKNVLSSYSTWCYSSYGCLDANAEGKSTPPSEKQHDKLRGKPIASHKQTEVKRKDRSPDYSSGVSFYAQDTIQPLENPTKTSSPKVTAVTSEQNVENCRWQHQMQSKSYTAVADLASIPKQLHQTLDGIEGQCEVENVSTELPDLDIDSSVALEGSRMSSLGCAKLSVEETSFLQLQCVMEQLDIRTKLCIRESLYRLARSAKQRHEEEHLGNSSRDDRDSNGEMRSEELNKCTAFVDVETHTNPIDRSIAHLLFHKPTEGESLDYY